MISSDFETGHATIPCQAEVQRGDPSDDDSGVHAG